MPRQNGAVVENTFTQGLITEATGMNFPKDAALETFNCVFDNTGAIRRRWGIDFETSYTNFSDTTSGNAINEYVWRNVAGLGTISFVVVQNGDILYFYKTSSTGALSANKKTFTIDLDTYEVSGATDVALVQAQFAEGQGYLFVTHPSCEPFYVTYDEGTDAISVVEIDVQIRDFEGVDDGLDIEERPTVETQAHKYNLFNQGWYVEARCEDDGGTEFTDNVYDAWNNDRTNFPANNDMWWLFRDANNNFKTGDNKTDRVKNGNTPAPKGHYIYTAWDIDRDSKDIGFAGITNRTSGTARPSTCAFYAGRVWYGGVNAPTYNNQIFYSQIIERDEQIGQCHQQQDPTAEDNNDLLATDGGVLVIQEMGQLIKMYAVGPTLILFATNGIWSIAGGEGTAFKATDFAVSKITTVGMSGATTFVDVDGSPMWWNADGIYGGALDKVSLQVDPTGISFSTIQSFFDSIPTESKKYAKGTFNRRTNTVMWLYRSTAPTTVTERFQYDRILCFNVITKAFYPWTLDTTTRNICGLVTCTTYGTVEGTSREYSSVTKFLTYHTLDTIVRLTFSEEYDTNYLDWDTYDYSSYFITGYALAGQAIARFQAPYLIPYLKSNQDTSIDVAAQWDFANSGDTGKWSNTQRIEIDENGYDWRVRRLKIRGKGRALQLKFTSITGEPFELAGWALVLSSAPGP